MTISWEVAETIYVSISERKMTQGNYLTGEKSMKNDRSFCKFFTPSIKVDSFLVLRDQQGIFSMLTAITLMMIFGFLILGFEVGKWYIVKAELSKTVDAASLLAATHQGNPNLDQFFGVGQGEGLQELVRAAGEANFHEGMYGAESPNLTLVRDDATGTIRVNAETDVANQFAGLYGKHETALASTGTAQKRDVEIMLVLDRSGSMSSAMGDLKDAAKSFVGFFEDTQAEDSVGLVSFSHYVSVDSPLGQNFVIDMEQAIGNMNATGFTNAEDALDQVDGPDGFTDATNVSQYVIFFTDGNPTAFRTTYDSTEGPYRRFTRNGSNHNDAVVTYSTNENKSLYHPDTGASLDVRQYKTGDGSSPCGGESTSTKWWILEDPDYGISQTDSLNGHSSDECDIPRSKMQAYVEEVGQEMAIDHAQELKENGIKIYTIGLGNVNKNFLAAIASGESFALYTTDRDELNDLFQRVAKEIKLRLVS